MWLPVFIIFGVVSTTVVVPVLGPTGARAPLQSSILEKHSYMVVEITVASGYIYLHGAECIRLCHLREKHTLTLFWPLSAHRSQDSLDSGRSPPPHPPSGVSLLWQYSMKTVINNSNVPGLWCSAGQQLICPGLFIVHFSRNSSHSCLIWIYSAVNVLSEGGFQPLLSHLCYILL